MLSSGYVFLYHFDRRQSVRIKAVDSDCVLISEYKSVDDGYDSFIDWYTVIRLCSIRF